MADFLQSIAPLLIALVWIIIGAAGAKNKKERQQQRGQRPAPRREPPPLRDPSSRGSNDPFAPAQPSRRPSWVDDLEEESRRDPSPARDEQLRRVEQALEVERPRAARSEAMELPEPTRKANFGGRPTDDDEEDSVSIAEASGATLLQQIEAAREKAQKAASARRRSLAKLASIEAANATKEASRKRRATRRAHSARALLRGGPSSMRAVIIASELLGPPPSLASGEASGIGVGSSPPSIADPT